MAEVQDIITTARRAENGEGCAVQKLLQSDDWDRVSIWANLIGLKLANQGEKQRNPTVPELTSVGGIQSQEIVLYRASSLADGSKATEKLFEAAYDSTTAKHPSRLWCNK